MSFLGGLLGGLFKKVRSGTEQAVRRGRDMSIDLLDTSSVARGAMTDEERKQRRKERYEERKRLETPEQKEKRLKKAREQARKRREGMTPEQKETARKKAREQAVERRRNMTPEQVDDFKKKNNDSRKRRREALSPEEKAVLREKERLNSKLHRERVKQQAARDRAATRIVRSEAALENISNHPNRIKNWEEDEGALLTEEERQRQLYYDKTVAEVQKTIRMDAKTVNMERIELDDVIVMEKTRNKK